MLPVPNLDSWHGCQCQAKIDEGRGRYIEFKEHILHRVGQPTKLDNLLPSDFYEELPFNGFKQIQIRLSFLKLRLLWFRPCPRRGRFDSN